MVEGEPRGRDILRLRHALLNGENTPENRIQALRIIMTSERIGKKTRARLSAPIEPVWRNQGEVPEDQLETIKAMQSLEPAREKEQQEVM